MSRSRTVGKNHTYLGELILESVLGEWEFSQIVPTSLPNMFLHMACLFKIHINSVLVTICHCMLRDVIWDWSHGM